MWREFRAFAMRGNVIDLAAEPPAPAEPAPWEVLLAERGDLLKARR